MTTVLLTGFEPFGGETVAVGGLKLGCHEAGAFGPSIDELAVP